MKALFTLLLAFTFSIVGMSQTEWEESITPEVETNPFSWVCDSLQWDSQDFDADFPCITDANYYVIEFEVQEGQVINNVQFPIVSEDVHIPDPFEDNEYGDKILTFSQWYPGNSTYHETFNTLPGVSIVNNETQEVIHYIDRETLGNNYLSGDIYNVNTDIEEVGTYTMYVINEATVDYSGGWADLIDPFEGVFYFPNWPEYYLGGEAIAWIYDTYGEELVKPEGEDYVIGDITMSYELVAPEPPAFNSSYQLCDSDTLSFEATCVDGESSDEFTYKWERLVGEFTWGTVGTNCELDVSWVYSEGGENSYDYRLTSYYSFADSIVSNVFTVNTLPKPDWGYALEGSIIPDFEGCDLWFNVEIDSATYADGDMEGYYWTQNLGFNETLYVTGIGAQGFFAEFCFDPFLNEVDTIGSFLVEGIALNSCSTLDTTYVVYFDTDGSGTWNEGDSLDFRNFIVLGDTTTTDTTDTFVRELIGKNMKLYPNPTRDNFTIEHTMQGSVTFRVFTTTGILVRDAQITSEVYQTSIGDLEKGIYIITLSDGQETLTSRLVKSE